MSATPAVWPCASTAGDASREPAPASTDRRPIAARARELRFICRISAGLDLDVRQALAAAAVADRDLEHMHAGSDHGVGDFNAGRCDEGPDPLGDVDVVAAQQRDLCAGGIDFLAAPADELHAQDERRV